PSVRRGLDGGQDRLQRVAAVVERARGRHAAPDAVREMPPLEPVRADEVAAVPGAQDGARQRLERADEAAQPAAQTPRRRGARGELEAVEVDQRQRETGLLAVELQVAETRGGDREHRRGERAVRQACGDRRGLVVPVVRVARREDLLDLGVEEESPEIEVMDGALEELAAARAAPSPPRRGVVVEAYARRECAPHRDDPTEPAAPYLLARRAHQAMPAEVEAHLDRQRRAAGGGDKPVAVRE